MTCHDVRARELVEQYLSGQLAEDDATAYELHYFECDNCFAELEAARALRAALDSRSKTIRAEAPIASKRWLFWLAPIALAGAAGVLAVMILRPAPTPAPVTQVQVTPARDYTLLAALTPPVYASSTLRSTESTPQAQFRAAMQSYAGHDYAAAIPKLQAASALDPKALPPRFYLGACYLLTGDAVNAASTLQSVVADGPSDFLEESRFLLAQARLKQNNPDAALEQLTHVAAGKGDFSSKAQTLIDSIHRVQNAR